MWDSFHWFDKKYPPLFKGAACSGRDPELWTGEFLTLHDKRTAKQICRTCPVISECATYALKNPEMRGIWGGMEDYERTKIRRKMGSRMEESLALVLAGMQ